MRHTDSGCRRSTARRAAWLREMGDIRDTGEAAASSCSKGHLMYVGYNHRQITRTMLIMKLVFGLEIRIFLKIYFGKSFEYIRLA